MMSSLYDRLASKPGGEAALAAARLRREMLVALHHAFQVSGLRTHAEVARRLGVRRSAVSQVFKGYGNLRVNTIAQYLFALGFELDVNLVLAGEPRRAELEGRSVRSTWSSAPQTIVNFTFEIGGQPGTLQDRTTWMIIDVSFPYRLLDPVPESTSRVVLGELLKESGDAP
jgi:transcriptional regulator with XRE-family HTH domain